MQTNKIKINCPHCKKSIIITDTENILINNETKIQLSDLEDLFIKTCPKCNKRFKLKHHLLINNTDKKYIIYYNSSIDSEVLINKNIENSFSDLPEIKKRLVNSIDDLFEKIKIFNFELDDMALEIAKTFKEHKLENEKNIKISKTFFDYYDKENQLIGYKFYTDSEIFSESTTTEDYFLCKKYLANILKTNNPDLYNGFIKIDKTWAKKHLKI